MDKKTASEIDQQIKERGKKGEKERNRMGRTQTFDELYKGTCYVVKERTDSYKLKPIPQGSSKEPPKHFQTGDRVKNQYGRLLTVLVQIENLVIVKEEINNYHAKDLTMIERAVDTYQV